MIVCAHVVRALTLSPATADEVARRLLMNTEHVSRALRDLVAAGGVSRTRKTWQGGRSHGWEYVYTLSQELR